MQGRQSLPGSREVSTRDGPLAQETADILAPDSSPEPTPTHLSLPASMEYIAIKHLHITCAALSGSLFVLRGFWMLRDSALLQRRWVKIAPHIIDTLLLVSALMLVFWSGQYPFAQNWLTAKVVALIAYIVLGTIALKRGKTKPTRIAAFVAALAVFAYIVCVAVTRQALPFI